MSLHHPVLRRGWALGVVAVLALAGCSGADETPAGTAAPVAVEAPTPEPAPITEPAPVVTAGVWLTTDADLDRQVAQVRAARKKAVAEATAKAEAAARAEKAAKAAAEKAAQAPRPTAPTRPATRPSTRPTPAPTPDRPRPTTPDEEYLSDATAAGRQGLTDAEWITLGHAVCDAYDEGASTTAIVLAVLDLGLSEDAALAGMAAALNVYCPENWDIALEDVDEDAPLPDMWNIGPIRDAAVGRD